MRVLSLFDGISCGQIALNRLNIKIDEYYASEIKKHAIKLTQQHFPLTKQLGDITKLNTNDIPSYELLIGGSPYQDLTSCMKNRQGLKGEKSVLFWEYVRILKETKPIYFYLKTLVQCQKKISKLLQIHLRLSLYKLTLR